jgi:glycosyl transferase family 25
MTSPEIEQFLAFVGRIRLINLPHRTDRRAEFLKSLARAGFDPADPRIKVFAAIRPESAEGFPSIGARGCYLSHRAVLREFLDGPDPVLCVCEDDLDLAKDFRSRLPGVLRELEAVSWNIAYLGHHDLDPDAPVVGQLVRLDPSDRLRSTHFLLFDRKGAAAFLAYLDACLSRPPGHPDGGPMHADGALSMLRQFDPELQAVAFVPPLGDQRSSRTDIHALGLKDRIPIVRDIVERLRRVLN